jgi:hypothetical protein
MSEGSHAYHTGVSYKEHHGTGISLLFGQEMTYVVGSEFRTIVGMESKLNIGAIADVGLVTKVVLEYGAEIQWVGGMHFVMAGHGGGIYDDVYSVSAGKTDVLAFKKTKVFLKLTVAAQVGVAAVSISSARTTWMHMMPEVQKDGELKIDGNSGFFALATVNGQLLSLATVILTVALYWLLKKQSNLIPMSTMSINHLGYGFLGVSATPTGGALGPGSCGLALSPDSFQLSFDGSQREFNLNHGHGIIGFNSDGSSVIKGDSQGVSVTSNQFNVETKVAAPAAAPGAPPVPAVAPPSTSGFSLIPGTLASLWTSTATQSGNLTTNPSLAFLSVTDAVSGGSKVELKPNSVQIHSSTAGAANASLNLAGGTATLEGLNSSAKVELSNSSATLSFGAGSSIKIDATGVSIASGAITILSPTAPIPDVAKISEIAVSKAKAAAEALKLETKSMLDGLKQSLEEAVKEKIAGVIRTVEDKISTASAESGAK